MEADEYKVVSLTTSTPSGGREPGLLLQVVKNYAQYPLRKEIYTSVFTLKSMMTDKSC